MALLNVFKTLLSQKKKKKSSKKTKKSTSKKSALKEKKNVQKKKTKKVAVKKTIKKKSQSKRKVKKKRLPSNKKTKKPREVNIGIITHYFGKISVGIIKLKAPLRLGDKIHIKGAHDDFTQTVTSMQFNHKDISSASKGKEIGIKVIQKVHENDKVYKII